MSNFFFLYSVDFTDWMSPVDGFILEGQKGMRILLPEDSIKSSNVVSKMSSDGVSKSVKHEYPITSTALPAEVSPALISQSKAMTSTTGAVNSTVSKLAYPYSQQESFRSTSPVNPPKYLGSPIESKHVKSPPPQQKMVARAPGLPSSGISNQWSALNSSARPPAKHFSESAWSGISLPSAGVSRISSASTMSGGSVSYSASRDTPGSSSVTWSEATLPSAIATAAVDSWSREFLPEPSNFPRQQHASSSHHYKEHSKVQGQYASASTDNVIRDQEVNNNSTMFSATTPSDVDTTVQNFLRQVTANPGGFSQELAGFNLGQQDFADLENRLRQALSPNTLMAAISSFQDIPFDESASPSSAAGHEHSLPDSSNIGDVGPSMAQLPELSSRHGLSHDDEETMSAKGDDADPQAADQNISGSSKKERKLLCRVRRLIYCRNVAYRNMYLKMMTLLNLICYHDFFVIFKSSSFMHD